MAPLNITVCIITYRRPRGLQRLLDALDRQVVSVHHPFRLSIVIVDNDPARSASDVVEKFRSHSRRDVVYVHEPRPGIPIARNAALDAVPATEDFVCFIDDDEWPSPEWASAFSKAARTLEADCFYGPVAPSYPTPRPTWFVNSGVFSQWRYANGQKLDFAASNNVMISTRFIREHRLRFDERMRFTGGSDYLFFRQGVERGLIIRWVDSALVHEEIPPSRMTWSWILKRHYRIGNTFAVAERILGNKLMLCRRFVIGCLRIGLGIVMMPAMPFSAYYGMRAVAHVVRGAGMIVGLFGHRHEEYALGALAADRSRS